MRILMIASSFPKYPGEMTAPFIEEIAAAVVERGHEVHMLLPDHPELKRGDQVRGMQIHRYRYAPHPSLNVWGYAGALHNDVQMRNAALLVAPLAVASAWRTMAQLTAQQPFDLIHGHWSIPNGFPAWLLARQRKLPLIISTHGSDVSVAERTAPTGWINTAIMRYASAITAPSSDLTTRAAALGAEPAKLHVLPYCVDAVDFRPDPAVGAAFRQQHGLDTATPLLFTVGRMVEKKGFRYLVQAFAQVLAQHPTAKLMIGGYGPGLEQLMAQAADLGIGEAVLFPGAIGHDLINSALNAATIFILPSVRDRSGNVDGLPNTLLEAMGAGRPIIASKIAGVPGVITSGEHGLLVAPAQPQALSAAINDLLNQPERARLLGKAARLRVETELTWNRYAARLEQLYTAAIQSS